MYRRTAAEDFAAALHRSAVWPNGAALSAEFGRAPAHTQREFWAAVAKHVRAEREVARRVYSTHGIWPRGSAIGPRWDQRWRDRAYRRRLLETRGVRDTGFQSEDAERLKAIDAAEYIEALVGEEVPRSGKICCPLPDHEERTPSFHVRQTTWKCYGCGAWGTIYDLASRLWGLDLRGRDFLEVHERLMERFS